MIVTGSLAISSLPQRPKLTSPEQHTLSAGDFRRAISLGSFLDKGLRDRVAQSIRLWQDCETLASTSDRSGLKPYFDDRMATVRESVLSVYALASHLNSYRRSPVSADDLAALAKEIDLIEQDLAMANDSEVRNALDRQLRTKRTLLTSQRSLASTMEQATRQLDNTLALLRALNAHMRMTAVAGDDYIGGIQAVEEELCREVTDLQQVRQILSGFDTQSSLPPQLNPGVEPDRVSNDDAEPPKAAGN